MRKIKQITAIVLAAAMVITIAPSSTADAAKKKAKTLKLSRKTASVEVDKTVKIKLKNAKKSTKVKWKINKAAVASIAKKSTKGKKAYATVKGKTPGSAKLTATYKKGKKNKKLVCKITVTAANAGGTITQPTNQPQATATSVPQNTTPGGGDVVNNNTEAPAATDTPKPTKAPTPTPSPTPTATPIPSPDAQVAKINKEITIDGTVDSAWTFADALPISNWTPDEGKEASQTSNGQAKMLWTDKYFYILVTADDPELDFGNEAVYNQDSVEIFFDEHDKKEDYGKNNEFQYRLVCNPSPAADADPIGALTDKQYWNGEEIQSAVAATETGYACEFAIPLNDVPVENQFVGVEVQINDAQGGERNGTWNLFANPSAGDPIPYDSTTVFGDCQYVIKREPKVIELQLDSDHVNMEKPDQFKGNPDYDAMNSECRIDDENKWVYCKTANNLTVYFPEGRTVLNGEKAEVSVTGSYTPSDTEADGDVIFRMWMADTYDRVLKGDHPITQSNQILSDITREWLTGQADENGNFTADFTLTADAGEKTTEIMDADGNVIATYEPRGIADALMIKAPSYNGMMGDVVIKSVVITVYDPIEYVEPEPSVSPEPDEPTASPDPDEPTASPDPDAPTASPDPDAPTASPEPDAPVVPDNCLDLSKISITDGSEMTVNDDGSVVIKAKGQYTGGITIDIPADLADGAKKIAIDVDAHNADGEEVGVGQFQVQCEGEEKALETYNWSVGNYDDTVIDVTGKKPLKLIINNQEEGTVYTIKKIEVLK